MKTLHLDLDSAIIEASIQNLEYDIWNDPEDMPVINQSLCDVYLEEAKYLLQETGENYLPSEEYNLSHPYTQHSHIVWEGFSAS
jgi:hypothetical protein